MAPTREEANDLIAAPKVIASKAQWKPRANGYRLEADVVTIGSNPAVMRLVGNCTTESHGFSLLLENCPIRRYGSHTPHHINKVWVDKPHKHRWDGVSETSDWYYPDDIDPEDDITNQLQAFCCECNIEVRDPIQGVIVSPRGRP